jgi:hypothetical protein
MNDTIFLSPDNMTILYEHYITFNLIISILTYVILSNLGKAGQSIRSKNAPPRKHIFYNYDYLQKTKIAVVFYGISW